MNITSAVAAQSYGAARPVTAPDPTGQGDGFADAALRAAGSFTDTLSRGEAASQASLVGDADPHALVTALAEAELAVETAVNIRNKVVEAYLEVLRMPV